MENTEKKIRILGIDPGSIITGFGIVDSDGTHSLYVSSGPLRVRAETLSARLRLVFEGITGVIEQYHPDVVVIEKAFMNRNADSALKLGQARGAAISAAVIRDLSVFEYTPRHIKQAVVGKGSATKEQIQHMVKILLNHQGELQSDEADALAIAISHGHISGTLARMNEDSRPTAYKRKR